MGRARFEYAALRKAGVSASARDVRRIGAGWVSFTAAIECFTAGRHAAERAGEVGRAMVETHDNG